MLRLDLRADTLRANGEEPWAYRCAWTRAFRFTEDNPDWQTVLGAERLQGLNLTGATVRWTLADSEADYTTAPVQTLENTNGAVGGDGQIVFTDALDGRVEIRMGASDIVTPRANRWFRVFISLPGEDRELVADGPIDTVPAQAPDARINVNV